MIARLARGIITCLACVLVTSQRGSNVFTRDKAARDIFVPGREKWRMIRKAEREQNMRGEALIESFK